jgi:hypothetical protein
MRHILLGILERWKGSENGLTTVVGCLEALKVLHLLQRSLQR